MKGFGKEGIQEGRYRHWMEGKGGGISARNSQSGEGQEGTGETGLGRQREIKDERKGGREEEREQGRAGMEGKEKRRRRREEGNFFFFWSVSTRGGEKG